MRALNLKMVIPMPNIIFDKYLFEVMGSIVGGIVTYGFLVHIANKYKLIWVFLAIIVLGELTYCSNMVADSYRPKLSDATGGNSND